jgi:RNA polymerase sigma-70 factor (ECF subfamily)
MTSGPPFDDFESELRPLWASAQAGDEVAYRESLRRIAARLRTYLRRRMQSLPDDVEDLVQETLLAIHLQRGTYDPEVPVSRWALAIARHKLIDLWRRRGRREALQDPLQELAEADQPAVWDELPVQRDLETLLGGLPEAQQQAIALIKLEGLSVAEASQRTGVSVSALKVQVHRGLKRLAELVRKA